MLNTLLTKIRKIDKKHQKALEKLGLLTIKDLLFHFPQRYDDFSTITKIANLKPNQKATIKGIVQTIENERTARKRMIITKALIKDTTGSLLAIWFNQPYLARFIIPGTWAMFSGKVEHGFQGLQLSNPVYEKIKKDQVHTGRIVPVYSVTEDISSKWLRFMIKPLLKYAFEIKDFLPWEIKTSQNLIALPEAIRQIHFPDSQYKLKKAKERLSFDELFLIQLKALSSKLDWQKNKAYPIKFNQDLAKSFVKSLPYQLTKAQRISAFEILKDLEKEKPMNRLLEGDVGSGKTVVAAMAMLEVAKTGLQTCLMAPTEILARQHFKTISGLLSGFKINIGLLTSADCQIFKGREVCRKKHVGDRPRACREGGRDLSGPPKAEPRLFEAYSRPEFLNKLAINQIQILIGTHALLEEKVKFKNLALAIVDEQHRFGVEQRATLKKINKSGQVPHLLSMTATPIPRTLALSIYGDLDLSIIDQLPPGRKEIKTYIVPPEKRDWAYDFIACEIKKGRQIYVVCPLIEKSDKLGVKAAITEYEKLKKKVFPQFKIGLLHGKLKKEEKEKTMRRFGLRQLDILVTTPVIEVGIDVPNVTVMMIEGAERFGLAQMYQFRGRVGRSEHQSYCFLFCDRWSDRVKKRLKALEETKSGFELAEIDLKMRGPGEVLGTRQWGIPDLHMASLMDAVTLKKARDEAKGLLDKDPQLKNFPYLRQKIGESKKLVHLE